MIHHILCTMCFTLCAICCMLCHFRSIILHDLPFHDHHVYRFLFKALYRNHEEPTQIMVLVVSGTVSHNHHKPHRSQDSDDVN